MRGSLGACATLCPVVPCIVVPMLNVVILEAGLLVREDPPGPGNTASSVCARRTNTPNAPSSLQLFKCMRSDSLVLALVLAHPFLYSPPLLLRGGLLELELERRFSIACPESANLEGPPQSQVLLSVSISTDRTEAGSSSVGASLSKNELSRGLWCRDSLLCANIALESNIFFA